MNAQLSFRSVFIFLFLFLPSTQAALRCDYEQLNSFGPAALTTARLFGDQSRIGASALVRIRQPGKKTLSVIVDAQSPWIQRELDRHFQKPVTKLGLAEIQGFVDAIRARPTVRKSWLQRLGSQLRGRQADAVPLEKLLDSPEHRDTALTLLTQALVEKYTKWESRPVVLSPDDRGGPAVLIKMKDGKLKIYTPGKPERALAGEGGKSAEIPLPMVHDGGVEIIPGSAPWSSKDKEKRVTVFTPAGKPVEFNVYGPGPGERKYKSQQSQIEAAEPNDLVPVEVVYHPFNKPGGHTTIRIGTSLFNLSLSGWQEYSDRPGGRKINAYMFYNPFFKRQYAKFAEKGMPPFSVGATIMLPKSQVVAAREIFEKESRAAGKDRKKFDAWSYSCNQGILCGLRQAGVRNLPGPSGILGRSSALTVRKLLLGETPQKTLEFSLYTLPGIEVDEAMLRKTVPDYLYGHYTTAQEVKRLIYERIYEMDPDDQEGERPPDRPAVRRPAAANP